MIVPGGTFTGEIVDLMFLIESSMKGQLNTLMLVYHPFSNQEGDWLWEDPEVRNEMQESKLYMIGQREEIFFRNPKIPDDGCLHFDLVFKKELVENVKLNLPEMLPPKEGGWNIEFGEKIIRVRDDQGELLLWFTPDKLLFDHWRGKVLVEGLEQFRQMTTFSLHYIGISNKGDSFSRLFEEGHHKRVKILGNEWPMRQGARVSDELFMFLFEIEDIGISINTVPDIQALLNPNQPALDKVYADAEKAFIKIMDTQYNEVKYSNYPQGLDGLYGQDIDRYGYVIGEDISFTTRQTTIVGATLAFGQDEDHGDLIAIDGDNVELHKFSNQAEAASVPLQSKIENVI